MCARKKCARRKCKAQRNLETPFAADPCAAFVGCTDHGSATRGVAIVNTAVHPHVDRQERTDSSTGHTVTDIARHRWLREGNPGNGLKIYFDSEASRRAREAIAVGHPEHETHRSLDNPVDNQIDEGWRRVIQEPRG